MDLNAPEAACSGADYWPFVFLSGILFAHALTRLVPEIRHSVSVCLSILSVQVFVFNVLHDSCLWAWWGNALADLGIASLIFYRLRRRDSYLLRILFGVTMLKVMWSVNWYVREVGSLDYAIGNNKIWATGCLVVVCFAIFDVIKSIGRPAAGQ